MRCKDFDPVINYADSVDEIFRRLEIAGSLTKERNQNLCSLKMICGLGSYLGQNWNVSRALYISEQLEMKYVK